MPPTQDTTRAPRLGIKPGQFAHHLKCQFPRWGHDQGQRHTGLTQSIRVAHQRARNGKPEAYRLARSGLRRNQQVGVLKRLGGNRLLNFGQLVIPTL